MATTLKSKVQLALKGEYEPKSTPRSSKDSQAYGGQKSTKISRPGAKLTGALKSLYGLYLDLDDSDEEGADEVRELFGALFKIETDDTESVHLAYVVSDDWACAPVVPKTIDDTERDYEYSIQRGPRM